MDLNQIINENITSSKELDEKLNKMFAARDGLKLVFMWVKQGTINYKQFNELIKWYTRG